MTLNAAGASITNNATHSHLHCETRDIVLPHQHDDLNQIAVDIGGSLAKVVWFSKSSDATGGRMNFTKFETKNVDECIDFIQQVLNEPGKSPVQLSKRLIKATGGGAHKFYELMQEKLGVKVYREDEMECLITGLNFLVREIPDEVFTYDERRTDAMIFEETPSEIFPYMLVNIGSGVSILKVTSDETYERISGTSLGGGTLWGLLSLLTNAKSYDEMLELSKSGDNKNVDMLVGDIYGGDYSKIGLKATTIASSFGKVFKASEEERKGFKQEDISRSLLYLVSNNIGQIAYLNAQAHGIQHIYFSGFFIRGHPVTMNTLNYAINYWSKGKIKALFLRHEGYLGAMGAFIRHTPRQRQTRLGSFSENFSHIHRIIKSSTPHSEPTSQNSYTNDFELGGTFDIDTANPLSSLPFPLLSSSHVYSPDTSDLMGDSTLFTYWVDLLDKNLGDLVSMLTRDTQDQNVGSRAREFEELYRTHLQRLRKEPHAYGAVSVRSLLNLREQCLREMGFCDVFEQVKKDENDAAFAQYQSIIAEGDAIPEKDQLMYLSDNVLAGNMYDWGSASVQALLKKGDFGFDVAKQKVVHSDKFNSIEKLNQRLASNPYKKAIIFVDNSGADILLGVLPFARYFLKRGTTIILAANTRPAVNDITAFELESLLKLVAGVDKVVADALASRHLKVVATGSASPCLDLRRVSEDLISEADGTDLIIIEGMGRAIHTNFHAKFSVDTLKIVFKNPQVAQELGARMYDGIRIFEKAS